MKTADDERLLVKLVGSNTGWNDEPVKIQLDSTTLTQHWGSDQVMLTLEAASCER